MLHTRIPLHAQISLFLSTGADYDVQGRAEDTIVQSLCPPSGGGTFIPLEGGCEVGNCRILLSDNPTSGTVRSRRTLGL